ncbi:hypothetical protein DIPPA_17535 [Diplonema papillatum]|nr:hypothetical protein DIPPA_17535 [Diplonema papillatum]
MAVVTRMNLPGNRESAVTLSAGEPGVARMRAAVEEVVAKSTAIDEPPMPGGKNAVRVEMAVAATDDDEDVTAIVTIAADANRFEIAKRKPGRAVEDASREYYTASEDVCRSLHRLFLTEFMLRDSMAGHPASSFVTHSGAS